jgi:hypothetical protein
VDIRLQLRRRFFSDYCEVEQRSLDFLRGVFRSSFLHNSKRHWKPVIS